MAFPHATLCVQGIKDGTSRSAIEAQFEEFGKIIDVTITPNKQMKGVPDSRIALVEYKRRDDARRAMQALNGRYVQGKCVMIRFARSAPGVKPPMPLPRRGALELIPQTSHHAALLSAKFKQATSPSPEFDAPEDADEPHRRGRSGVNVRDRSRSRTRRSRSGRSQRRFGHATRESRSRSRRRSRNRGGRRGEDRCLERDRRCAGGERHRTESRGRLRSPSRPRWSGGSSRAASGACIANRRRSPSHW
eukprot:TRINITY_DN34140_c0_g1_i1.p1 TRINITY_DN34140_c0_g1~~TRINITY_DN34140_c0_g1_i1.p1  ORF type:complete len:248 (+),score=24.53 TRINITY_DN34140_c0_g1_i1:253-996(+)